MVVGFYPLALANSERALSNIELADASQGWLDANPDATAALRRVVSENHDGVTRALAAQQRDGA